MIKKINKRTLVHLGHGTVLMGPDASKTMFVI